MPTRARRSRELHERRLQGAYRSVRGLSRSSGSLRGASTCERGAGCGPRAVSRGVRGRTSEYAGSYALLKAGAGRRPGGCRYGSGCGRYRTRRYLAERSDRPGGKRSPYRRSERRSGHLAIILGQNPRVQAKSLSLAIALEAGVGDGRMLLASTIADAHHLEDARGRRGQRAEGLHAHSIALEDAGSFDVTLESGPACRLAGDENRGCLRGTEPEREADCVGSALAGRRGRISRQRTPPESRGEGRPSRKKSLSRGSATLRRRRCHHRPPFPCEGRNRTAW